MKCFVYDTRVCQYTNPGGAPGSVDMSLGEATSVPCAAETLAGFADGKFSLWKVDSDAERGVGGGRRCED